MWTERSSIVCRACLIEGSDDLIDFTCNIFVEGLDDVKYKVADCFEEISTILIPMDEAKRSKLCHQCYNDLQAAMQFKLRSNESNRRILLENENEQMMDDDDEIEIPISTDMLKNEELKLEVMDFLIQEVEETPTQPEVISENIKLDAHYICDRCGENFKLKFYLRDHMKHCIKKLSHQGTIQPYSNLPVCGRMWDEKYQRGRPICFKCNVMKSNYQIFKRHYYTTHLDQNALLQEGKTMIESNVPFNPSSNKKLPFECKTCSKRFSNRKFYDDHRLQHKYIYECDICKARFKSIKGLSDHVNFFNHEPHDMQDSLKLVPPYDLYQCVFCSRYLMDPVTLRNHYKYLHHNQQPKICKACGRQFDTMQKLWDHREEMKGKTHTRNNVNSSLYAPFKCIKCHVDFKTDRQLQEHIAKCKHVNQNKIEHQCKYCMFKTDTDMSFQRHMMKKHNITHGRECDLCSRTFQSLKDLKAHIATHLKKPGEAPICDSCGKQFQSKNSLIFHIRRFHDPASLLVCQICSKTFATKSQQRRHGFVAHLKQHAFTCLGCSKNYNVPTLVKDHILRKHLNFSIDCSICSKKYFVKRTLQRHLHASHEQHPKFKEAWELCGAVKLPSLKELAVQGHIKMNKLVKILK